MVETWGELLITDFMSQYPGGVETPPYAEFVADVFDTLGRGLMHPSLWDGDEIVVDKSLLSYSPAYRAWQWYEKASGDFSAQMFFALKYLPADAIEEWVASIVALPSRFYQAQFLLWLLATRDVVLGAVACPKDFRKKPFDFEWANSHCLSLATGAHAGARAVFLPPPNRAAFHAAVETHLTQSKALEWLLGFEQVPQLNAEIIGLGRDADFLAMFDAAGRFALYAS